MSDKKELNLDELQKVAGGYLNDFTKEKTIDFLKNAKSFEDIAEFYKNLYQNRDFLDPDGDVVPFVEEELRKLGYDAHDGEISKI